MVYVQRMYMHVCMWVREGRERGEPTITLPCLPPDQVASFCVLHIRTYIVLYYITYLAPLTHSTHPFKPHFVFTPSKYPPYICLIHAHQYLSLLTAYSLFAYIHKLRFYLLYMSCICMQTHTHSLPPPSFLSFKQTSERTGGRG